MADEYVERDADLFQFQCLNGIRSDSDLPETRTDVVTRPDTVSMPERH